MASLRLYLSEEFTAELEYSTAWVAVAPQGGFDEVVGSSSYWVANLAVLRILRRDSFGFISSVR